MSTIRLSEDLLREVQEVLQRHDDAAADSGIGVQYLAAVIGFLTSNFPVEPAQQQDFLRQLFDFAEQVRADHSGGAAYDPANDPAFGVWKP
jgi:hypothetical protein